METDIISPVDYIKSVVDFRKQVFEKITKRDPDPIWLKSSLENIKKVVIISSASRSGSSLLAEVLKQIPGIYSLSGESAPFYKLNGLSGDLFPSDDIPSGLENETGYLAGLSRDLLSDLSIPFESNDVFNDNGLLEQYVDDLVLRFPLQWPGIEFSYDTFRGLAFEALDTHRSSTDGFRVKEFYLELLSCLRREYNAINPYYYDIPIDMVQKKFPGIKIPAGPPNSVLTIEEPLFILLSPSRMVSSVDLGAKTLLLKSSVDCYRMRFIERLFPAAELKIIYLTRNPAASINGLYDGWLHRGFFSHNLGFLFGNKAFGLTSLEISGYSDKYPWGRQWWNYDLPSGWQDHAKKRLEEVCGFQWYSANKSAKLYLDETGRKCCRVRCEDLFLSKGSLKVELEKIADFIGLGRDAAKNAEVENLPVVQASEKPENCRWKKRKDIILPVIDAPAVSEMSANLGYNKNKMGEWI
jgi:hypothetical protein